MMLKPSTDDTMRYGNLLIASLRSLASLHDMIARINYNLNFKTHCEELRQLRFKPSTSFIVPTRNEAFYLPRLLASINYITNMCRVPVEVIVADYKSVDGTPEIARKYGAKVIEVDRPGVGYASYISTLKAKGDIIIRTDADVFMTPSAILEVVKLFNSNAKKLIVTVGHIYYPLELFTNIMAYLYDRYLRKPYNTTGYFIAFKREIVEKLNFNPRLRANDDWDFGARASRLLGLNSLHYNWWIAVLVSPRLLKKKGYVRYIMEGLSIIRTTPTPYSQL